MHSVHDNEKAPQKPPLTVDAPRDPMPSRQVERPRANSFAKGSCRTNQALSVVCRCLKFSYTLVAALEVAHALLCNSLVVVSPEQTLWPYGSMKSPT
jgi:hypothetical protein